MRKEMENLKTKLRVWLPSETEEFKTLFFRILASLPGGEELEDIGYEPLPIGWLEAGLIAETLSTVQGRSDVEWLVKELLTKC